MGKIEWRKEEHGSIAAAAELFKGTIVVALLHQKASACPEEKETRNCFPVGARKIKVKPINIGQRPIGCHEG